MSSCTKTAGDVFFRLNGGKLGGFHKQCVFFSGFYRNKVELAGLLRMLCLFIWSEQCLACSKGTFWPKTPLAAWRSGSAVWSTDLLLPPYHMLNVPCFSFAALLEISFLICIVPTIPLAVNLSRLWWNKVLKWHSKKKKIHLTFLCLHSHK